MFVELHILQNFAPSNLNRDDTGTPKDCEFGGYRRARISSQCLKRAIRTTIRDEKLLDGANIATRTRLLMEELTKRLEAGGKPRDGAQAVVAAALGSVGVTVKDDGKTQYLLYLGAREIDAVAGRCMEHWDALLEASAASTADDEQAAAAPKSAKKAKKAAKEAVPAPVAAALKSVLDGGRAADLALFGRMLADLPDKNVDAACQVAHALSTNKVSMEFDFYTAVDDLKPDDTSGAGMLGTIEFNSACFYRYANVDLGQLARNLGGDEELTRASLAAFLRAAITTIPTGKQNSMAAQNPPSLVFSVARGSGLWSLANAFVKPVRASVADGDLVATSARALDDYWGKLTRMYGSAGLKQWVCLLDGDDLQNLKGARVDTVDDLITRTLDAVQVDENTAGAGAA